MPDMWAVSDSTRVIGIREYGSVNTKLPGQYDSMNIGPNALVIAFDSRTATAKQRSKDTCDEIGSRHVSMSAQMLIFMGKMAALSLKMGCVFDIVVYGLKS
jgi:hypothetical protein